MSQRSNARLLRALRAIGQASALVDISNWIAAWHDVAADLYYCPACGYMITDRYEDKITHCWGPCLEEYGEAIPLTFVRGIGPGRSERGLPF